MKTGRKPPSVVQVNYAFDKGLTDPDQLLDRYFTLTGWSEALRRAGAAPVAVVQRFHRDAHVVRNGVDYLFRRTGLPDGGRRAPSRRRARQRSRSFRCGPGGSAARLDPSCAIVVQSHADGGAIGRAPALRLLGRAARARRRRISLRRRRARRGVAPRRLHRRRSTDLSA